MIFEFMGRTTVDNRTTNEIPCLWERARMKIQTEKTSIEVVYVDLSLLLPTTNICERLFSKVGYALADRRKGLLSSNFESHMFFCTSTKSFGTYSRSVSV